MKVPKQGTQNYTILRELERGRALTHRDASRLGIDRLAARAYDLEWVYGWPIKRERVSRGGKHFARYRLGAA